MKHILLIIAILISSQSYAYINETYDCKMKNFIGIDKDGLPKKWREQKFSFKWKDDFTIQFGKGGYFDNLTSERIGWFSANKDSFNIQPKRIIFYKPYFKISFVGCDILCIKI